MHARGAGGHYNSGQLMLCDCFLEQGLPRVRTHILVVGCISHTGYGGYKTGDLLHIHRAGDVLTAMANKYADSRHLIPQT